MRWRYNIPRCPASPLCVPSFITIGGPIVALALLLSVLTGPDRRMKKQAAHSAQSFVIDFDVYRARISHHMPNYTYIREACTISVHLLNCDPKFSVELLLGLEEFHVLLVSLLAYILAVFVLCWKTSSLIPFTVLVSHLSEHLGGRNQGCCLLLCQLFRITSWCQSKCESR